MPIPRLAQRSGPVSRTEDETSIEQRKLARRARRKSRYDEMIALGANGASVAAIHRALGLSRKNVIRWKGAGAFPERQPAERRQTSVYVLKDDLKQLWRFRDPGAMRRFWKQSYRRAVSSRIPAFMAFAENLSTRIEDIISHWQYPLHTGILEGINNNIEVIKRMAFKQMAYGYRDDAYVFFKPRCISRYSAKSTKVIAVAQLHSAFA